MTCLFLSISGSPHHYSPWEKWHIKCKDQQSWKGNNPYYSQSQSTKDRQMPALPGAPLGFNLIHRALSWGKERIQLKQANVYSLPFLIRLLKKPVENVGTRKAGSFSSRIHPKTHCTASLLAVNWNNVLSTVCSEFWPLLQPLHLWRERQKDVEGDFPGWKRSLRSSSPTINPTPPCVLLNKAKRHLLNPPRDGDSTLPWIASFNA